MEPIVECHVQSGWDISIVSGSGRGTMRSYFVKPPRWEIQHFSCGDTRLRHSQFDRMKVAVEITAAVPVVVQLWPWL